MEQHLYVQYKKEIIEGVTDKLSKTKITNYVIYKIKSLLYQFAKLKDELFY